LRDTESGAGRFTDFHLPAPAFVEFLELTGLGGHVEEDESGLVSPDLENPAQRAALQDNAFTLLDSLRGLIVIDEVQELPALFPALRVLADRDPLPARFVILGSVAPELIRGIGESLAGRVLTIPMGGFDLDETPVTDWPKLWLRGGYPRSYLAESDAESALWRDEYLAALLNRDLRIWSNLALDPGQARRLLLLIADTSGRAWNHSEASRILGVDSKTVQNYLHVIEAAFLTRTLPPLEANIRKRLRKAPTIHLRDSGILHSLLGIQTRERLEFHPRMGQSWESFCVDQVIRLSETRPQHCFTFSVQSGQEIDLILDRPDGRYGFEIKSSENSRPKPADRELVKALDLKALHQVRRGNGCYDLGDGLFSTGIEDLPAVCAAIRGF
jgi:predicted AAA+ superfamily ATPase